VRAGAYSALIITFEVSYTISTQEKYFSKLHLGDVFLAVLVAAVLGALLRVLVLEVFGALVFIVDLEALGLLFFPLVLEALVFLVILIFLMVVWH